MLCSYNFLAQNLLIMMTFCCLCLKTGGRVSMISVLWTTAALMGSGRALPPLSPPRKGLSSLLGARIWASVFEAHMECGWYQGPTLPIVSSDFARAKGWCLYKIPSFGAALRLSATSIVSAWGTTSKDMASDTHWCPGTLALVGGCRGQAGCISPRC